jgi:hypothetical protein
MEQSRMDRWNLIFYLGRVNVLLQILD